MPISPIQQAQIMLEDFEKDKDFLMREVGKNLDVIAWICWGLELYFEDFSYNQMKDYMEKPDYEDIKKHIYPVLTRVRDFQNGGIEFDVMDVIEKMLKNKFHLTGLDIENEAFYSEKRLTNRTLVYLAAVLFYLERDFTGNKYDEIPSVVSLWILPNPGSKKRKNSIEIIPIPGSIEVIDCSSTSDEPRKIHRDVKLTAYYYFLGNPLEVKIDADNEDESYTKKKYLMLLLDCLFNYEASVEKKLEILEEKFSLKGDELEKEVRDMTELMKEFDEFTGGVISKYETLEEKYEALEERNGALEKRNGTLETEDKIKTERIETLEKRNGTLEKRNGTLEKRNESLINQLIDHGITPAI